MTSSGIAAPTCCIIACGNPQRGDEGIGRYVANCLNDTIQQMSSVVLRTLPHLDVTLLEEIHSADHLIFVDTSTEEIENGLRWVHVTPELNGWAMGSNPLTPMVFLGLLHLLYQSKPSAWMVSVQGRNFNPGQGLSAEARRDAERAAAQIVNWLCLHGIAFDGQKKHSIAQNRG